MKYKVVAVKWKDASRSDNRPLDFETETLLAPKDWGLLYGEYTDKDGVKFIRLVHTYESKFNNNNFSDIPKDLIISIKEFGEDELE